MSFEAGEEIIASLSKDLPKAACGGVIIKPEPEGDRLQIALQGRGLILRHGSLVHLRSKTHPEVSAWSSVQRVSLAGEVKIVDLTSVRIEGDDRRRAARYPIELAVSTKMDGDGVQTTKGFSIDLSVSGIKAWFDQPLPEQDSVYIALHLADEKNVEAYARITRREEMNGADAVVALEFQSFIRGYEFLLELLPPESSQH